MTILDRYFKEKQRFLENCTQCGLCAKGCPVLPHTDNNDISSRDIQKGVFDYMEQGVPNRLAFTKAFACMECFKCTVGMCPEDLNPMMVNELIKGEYIAAGLAEGIPNDSNRLDSVHRVIARLQVSASEYDRITTENSRKSARYLFFPGCNVYFQPDKILNALDLLDAIGHEYTFLPGLVNCCGNDRLFAGDIHNGSRDAGDLVKAISRYQPEAVVLWCPTCHCRFETDIAHSMDLPFQILSFPQYLAENMDKLPVTEAEIGTVTLHEPCKSVYTGADRDGVRAVLQQLPGVTLKEMTHHGADTLCCGSGAVCWFPESDAKIRKNRLEEAARTGADRLVTVCHYCGQTFAAEASGYDFSIINYVSLVAEAVGIRREDRFGKYTRWNDLERILGDAEERVGQSSFEQKRIVEVLQSVFIK